MLGGNELFQMVINLLLLDLILAFDINITQNACVVKLEVPIGSIGAKLKTRTVTRELQSGENIFQKADFVLPKEILRFLPWIEVGKAKVIAKGVKKQFEVSARVVNHRYLKKALWYTIW